MASLLHVVAGALVAVLLWTAMGWAFSRRLFGGASAWPLAAATGWAVHNVVAVLVFRFIPFTAAAAVAVAAVIGCVGVIVAALGPAADRTADEEATVPRVAWLAAAVLAALCAAAILPKATDAGVVLADPIYDHAKVALIDDIAHRGMPPGNPYMTPEHGDERLSYYYLWHFSAAEVARVLPITGWEADAAMTFFSAFASLLALMAVAVRGARHPGAAVLVVPLAAASSSRVVWITLFGAPVVDAWTEAPGGFGGWMFQAPWVPQHIASATCVVLTMLAIARLERRGSVGGIAAVALFAAAAFESSTWIGGGVLPVVCVFVVPWLVLRAPPRRRASLLVALAVAGVAAAALAWPFIVDQLVATSARRHGSPIVLRPFPVFGPALAHDLQEWLDWPAFFLLLLPVEWTAAYLFGVVAVVGTLRRDAATQDAGLAALAIATLAALLSASLLVSTLADNNDLGWRAGLLSSTLLIPFAAIGIWRALERRRWIASALAATALALGVPAAAVQIARDVGGRTADRTAAGLAAAPALWAAVRAHAAPDERVSNNPLALAAATPWAVNIGWALFADRRSCYSTWELTQVYSSVPHERLRRIDQRFVDVFAGKGTVDDAHALATTYDCRVVVVTPDDGAWLRDPFAKSADYRLVDEQAGRWRIYRSRLAPDYGPRR